MITLNVERFWISPYVFSVYVTLREKALPFEIRELATESHDTVAPEYLKRTVTGRVPSLENGDVAVAESSAIVEYLEEAFPTPRVLPADVAERARCRQIMSWLRSDDTAPLREDRPTTAMFFEPAKTALTPAGKRSADKLVEVCERLLANNKGSLFGAWCIADSELAFMLHRLIMNGHHVPPATLAFAKTQWARPSVREFVERKRPEWIPH
jgi:glutathione S-transferase